MVLFRGRLRDRRSPGREVGETLLSLDEVGGEVVAEEKVEPNPRAEAEPQLLKTAKGLVL